MIKSHKITDGEIKSMRKELKAEDDEFRVEARRLLKKLKARSKKYYDGSNSGPSIRFSEKTHRVAFDLYVELDWWL